MKYTECHYLERTNDASQKNIQGDVTSIIEPSGETMISFSYDPWGNITYIADESLDETAKP